MKTVNFYFLFGENNKNYSRHNHTHFEKKENKEFMIISQKKSGMEHRKSNTPGKELERFFRIKALNAESILKDRNETFIDKKKFLFSR
jgi:hypothetical protein